MVNPSPSCNKCRGLPRATPDVCGWNASLYLPGIRGRSGRDGRENLVAETSSRPPTTSIGQQHEDGVERGGVTHSTKFSTIRLTRFSRAFLPDRPISPRSGEALRADEKMVWTRQKKKVKWNLWKTGIIPLKAKKRRSVLPLTYLKTRYSKGSIFAPTCGNWMKWLRIVGGIENEPKKDIGRSQFLGV